MTPSPYLRPERRRFQWQWNGKLLIFCALGLVLTTTAGFWQLRRAEEKRELLDAFAARSQQKPVALETVDPAADQRYRRILLSGVPDRDHQFLLDNRVRDGRAGYEVLVPVRYGAHRWVLVNRGWLPRGLNRAELPEIPPLPEHVVWEGYLYKAATRAPVLGPQEPVVGWPQVVQQPDRELFEQRLGRALLPYQVRLENSPGFDTRWITTNLPPAQHIGYAVQWFGLTVVLVVLGFVSNSNLVEWMRSARERGHE